MSRVSRRPTRHLGLPWWLPDPHGGARSEAADAASPGVRTRQHACTRAAASADVLYVVDSRPRRAAGLVGGGDRAELAGLEVGEGLAELGLVVHHERAVPRDRLPDRAAAEDQHVQLGAARLLS